MKERLRFTGQWPPLKYLAKYPNWEYALDEEGVEGQDETTIRPQPNQAFIDDQTDYTSGNAQLADGRSLPAFLTFFHDPLSCPYVTVFLGDSEDWSLEYNSEIGRWEPFDESWLPENERGPVADMNDPAIFPLTITSVLPIKGRKKSPMKFTIGLGGKP